MPRLASYTTYTSTPTTPTVPSTGGSTGGGTSYTASAPVTLSGTAFGLGYDANTLAVSSGKLGISQSVMASIAAGQNAPVVDSAGNYVGPSQASFDTLQARVGEVEETDQELGTRLTTVEGIAVQNQTTVGQHSTRLTTIDGQVASLNSADNAQVGRLNGIDTALAALTPRVTGVETTNGVQSTDIVSLKDRATALENNKQAKHANLTSLSLATPTLPALQMQGNLNVTTVNGAAYPPPGGSGGKTTSGTITTQPAFPSVPNTTWVQASWLNVPVGDVRGFHCQMAMNDGTIAYPSADTFEIVGYQPQSQNVNNVGVRIYKTEYATRNVTLVVSHV